MLDSIENKNGPLIAIYKGDEIVWEAPVIMIGDVNLQSGFTTIKFKTYPGKCYVTVWINRAIVKESQSSPSGVFVFSLNTPLKRGDIVNLTLKKRGWKDTYQRYEVY